ncbi:enoyl-CoA hydratase [Marinomonas primoryensis]|uniref:3-hydroxyisobutyryl-CoA hydrolase n=1 Tax=Marinomonas primoryensis TaxID=178399 RepID=A0A2Z4PRS6_9GAMM|nr:enoyl-CoA hydratase/isomerase family protein [Marinomonas primoryensis]AWY00125.1 enoyl-CoA hydratase [Marinomonas primoryensis]
MSCVIFTEHATASGQFIGEICLNSEKNLNALTLDMIELILPKLSQWQDDPRISAVLLDSVGEKAFCAGGDVVSLHNAITSGVAEDSFAETFFTQEYRLDYLIHTYSKPIMCWGSGIVMGGGMGLYSGCSHRIVTQSSHLAMPEVSIGLYPDVGGSWFLNRMPGRTGLFLGLTGNAINAVDALFLGLADRAIDQSLRDHLLQRLQASDWVGSASQIIDGILRDLEADSFVHFSEMAAPIQQHQAVIRQLTDQDDVAGILAALNAFQTDDPWLIRAKKSVSHGSPVSLCLIKRQLERCRHISLKEVFQQELNVSVQCCRQRELPEGIRALLIDKDRQPKWTFATVKDVDAQYIDGLLTSPWSKDTHPLVNL